MDVAGKACSGTLYIFLSGELDEYSAVRARAEADELIRAHAGCSRVMFDLSGVHFMDSAGIGFLLGRYKQLSRSKTPAYKLFTKGSDAADFVAKQLQQGDKKFVAKVVSPDVGSRSLRDP